MRLWKASARISVVCLAAFSTGCSYSPETLDRTLAYNEAVSQSNNDILLYNIIQASQRYPTQYSRLEGNTAITTLTPQLQLTAPLSHSSQIQYGAAGALATAQITNAAASFVPQLQATVTNQLQLQSLDDQKYIAGMMTPIKPSYYQYFQNAGWTPETVGLMFIESIDIDAVGMKLVHDKASSRCDQKLDYLGTELCNGIKQPISTLCWGAKWAPSDPDGNTCTRIGSLSDLRPDGTRVDVSSTTFLDYCLAPGTDRTFLNNPALPSTNGLPGTACFETALRALIVLGLEVSDKPAKQKMSVVETGIPATLRRDPGFVSTLLTNGLTTADIGNGKIAICKSSQAPVAGGTSNASSPSSAPPAGSVQSSDSDFDVKQLPTAKGVTGLPEVQCKAAYDAINAPETIHSEDKSIISGSVPNGYLKDVHSENSEGTPYKIAISRRSTEGMIYYLGEMARVETSSSSGSVARSAEMYAKEGVPLFLVRRGPPPRSELISAQFGGATYYIPSPCLEENCSERPDAFEMPLHRSHDVLTLVEQMWGLQKEASAIPAAPAVTVINP
jgi:hypothetical protein